ncbi:hypothetical protein [Sphingobacterium thalpophilum]|uniref:hypothetical protein n=1 Tax=Sphingobacterium thalpophilum TaxID=259 RepID=UPI0031DEFE6E
MKVYRLLFNVTLSCLTISAFCQTASFPSVSPSSAEAFSFFKHGDIPTDNYLGIANIKVPIYKIDFHGFEFPITLQSSGQSIRVDELSSWVGLNWSLESNCYIDEVSQGENDGAEFSANYQALYNQLTAPNFNNSGMPLFVARKDAGAGMPNAVVTGWDYSVFYESSYSVNKILDYGLEYISSGHIFQPDIFHFSVLGYSGAFYQNPFTKNIEIFKGDQSLSVKKLPNNSGWEIVLPNGILFSFKTQDWVRVRPGYGNAKERRTWKVSKIILQNKNAIDFSYTSKTYNVRSANNFFGLNQYTDNDNLANTFNFSSPPPASGGSNFFEYIYSDNYLNKISFGNHAVIFNLTNDVKPLLNDLVVKDETNNHIVDHWKFNYSDYAKYNPTEWQGTEESKPQYRKIKLQSLHNLVNGQQYSFEYYEDIGLPHVFSKSRDYWDLFNGISNSTLLVDQTRITPFSGVPYQQLPTNILTQLKTQSGAIRTFDAKYAIQGMLKKIKYPTRGYTTFTYEPHRFFYQGGHIRNEMEFRNSVDSYGESLGAGFRIKFIDNFGPGQILINRKEFVYGSSGTSGVLHQPLSFWQVFPRYQEGYGYFHNFSLFSSTNYPNPLNTSRVGYSEITQIDHSVSQVDSYNTVFRYFNNQFIVLGDDNYTFAYEQDYRNGLIRSIDYYEKGPAPVRSTRYEYELVRDTTFKAIFADKEKIMNSTNFVSYKVFFLPIKTNIWKQTLVTDSLFTSSGKIVNKTNFSYTTDKFKNLKQETITTSNNVLKKEFHYPSESLSPINSELLLNNIVSIPIRESWYYEQTPTNSIFKLERNFKKWNSSFIKEEKIVSTGKVREEIVFKSYDVYGNPLEAQANYRPAITYLWGYNGQYPIAEIKNATYAQVDSVLTKAAIDNLNVATHSESTMETLIKGAADKLRAGLPNAMVTSYTYKPLVGMTSRTDPRGITEYYKYDGMQRLQAILDHLNHVNRAFDYHYRPN